LIRGYRLTASCPIIAYCLWQRAFKSGLTLNLEPDSLGQKRLFAQAAAVQCFQNFPRITIKKNKEPVSLLVG
jgi:hypothetical protein